jgi:hypothetical protein
MKKNHKVNNFSWILDHLHERRRIKMFMKNLLQKKMLIQQIPSKLRKYHKNLYEDLHGSKNFLTHMMFMLHLLLLFIMMDNLVVMRK